MKFPPQLEVNETTRDYQEEFGGYNNSYRISDYEFSDEKNMTADYYPVLSPRKKRGYKETIKKFSHMICNGALCVLGNLESDSDSRTARRLFINGVEIQSFNGTTTASISGNSEHKMVSMGAYLVVFRKTSYGLSDGWYINTVNLSESGYIDRVNVRTPGNSLTFAPCKKDGTIYENVTISSEAPTNNLNNGTLWLDTSDDVHYLKSWSKTNSMWVAISATYIKITCNNIGVGLKEGDAVNISTDSSFGVDTSVSGYQKIREQIKAIETTMIIESRNTNWIVVSGIIDKSINAAGGTLTVKRQAPYMDYVCESNNRLWGCRFGTNRDGNIVNEIYACKQGDFKNWQCYAGISTDSYAASVGSDGKFTGCIAYASSVLFFKENCIHKLFGSLPANYQIVESKVRGVQLGSEKSLCLLNETLFYKSATDICYYDGSLPVSISAALGEEQYKNAVFGAVGNKIYMSMQNSDDVWELLTYDVSKGVWHKEDNLQCKDICRVDNQLYYADADGNIGTFTGEGDQEADFAWYAETGNIGYSLSDNKYISRITVRISKPSTSCITIEIKYDEETSYHTVLSLPAGTYTKSFSVPIVPHRCDHFRLRFSGSGECKIISLSKTIEVGSEEYVY